MKNILIPTDFSSNAYNAAQYAVELFKDKECTFYLLNVFTVQNYSTANLMIAEPGNPAFDSAQIAAQKELKRVMDKLEIKRNPKHTFDILAKYNTLLDEVNLQIKKKDISLIVMGTKGASGKREVIFGSNAVTIMEKVIDCPVLAIPESAPIKVPSEIVYPTSYTHNYKLEEIAPLLELVREHNSVIRVMHVVQEDELSDTQRKNKQLLEFDLEGIEHSYHLLTNIDPETAIKCFVESRDMDMIAMINRKHSFFGRIINPPLVKGIGIHSRVPMLVMHRSS
ncbi:universal stress protein [Sungkyunkwania multivorans]|uniref:Universal stress protein n=1 Tax=Sungkyunkwania multivorans TaxID=1173618 RepID=A0ABW3D2Z2_9FLAO